MRDAGAVHNYLCDCYVNKIKEIMRECYKLVSPTSAFIQNSLFIIDLFDNNLITEDGFDYLSGYNARLNKYVCEIDAKIKSVAARIVYVDTDSVKVTEDDFILKRFNHKN